MNAVAAEDYCRNKAAPAGSSLYYSCLYLTPEQKQGVYALHSFGAEVADVLAECADPGVARIKFAWWQDEIQHLFNHQPRHPVSHELQKLINTFPFEQKSFTAVIRHYEQRLNQTTQPLSFAELKTFMLSGPAELWKLSAMVCAADSVQTEAWKYCGSLFGIFELLQQRPLRMLEDPIAIARQLYAALETACEQLMLDKARNSICVLILARIILSTSYEMLQVEGHLLRQKVSLTPLRKLWIAWRTKHRVMSNG